MENDKTTTSVVEQRFSSISPYLNLLHLPEHTWLQINLQAILNKPTGEISSVTQLLDPDQQDLRELKSELSPHEPPVWAVDHLYLNGLTESTYKDIVYGGVIKEVDEQKNIIRHDPMVKSIENIMEAGNIDLAYNFMMVWDLYYPLGQKFLSKIDPKDFPKREQVGKAIYAAKKIGATFYNAIAEKDFETALKVVAHVSRNNLRIRSIKFAEEVIGCLQNPETDEERIFLMTAMVMQRESLIALLRPNTYSSRLTNVEYKI